MDFYFLIFLSAAFAVGCTGKKQPAQDLMLWYDVPAQDWMTEALPIGNGFMGVMFFGEPKQERLQFSEGSLWAGGPGSGKQYNFGLREGAAKHLSIIRKLLKESKKDSAFSLTEKWMTGVIHPADGLSFGDYGAQQSMGEILVSVHTRGKTTSYRRELNLNTGRGRVAYYDNGTNHERVFFGCYPLRAMIYHFKNDSRNGINYAFEIKTPHITDSLVFLPGVFHLFGHIENNGLAFLTSVQFETDGNVSFEKGKVMIRDAQSLTLKHTAFTAYEHKFPDYRNSDWLAEAIPVLEKLAIIDYQSLDSIQHEDYSRLFSKVELELNARKKEDLPTNHRLERYAAGHNDYHLETLYFQFARYLMISSSRPGTLPMHLQGKWNHSTDPPWACDYHTNVNLQMLYWPAEVLNLSECHKPLFDYLRGLVPPGRLAAKTFFGANGWVVNTMNNAFGYVSPGWELPWGFFPAGAAWLTRHTWEHFEFSRNFDFLKQVAWPLMKEAAKFWEDYLIENEDGFLVSVPSFSPEQGGISSGASMDHQIAWDLFNNCLKAAELLGKNNEEIEKYRDLRDRIVPPKIGHWGQLQEWVEDLDDPHNQHRHISHLFALHPGQQINLSHTPKLAQAALTSLIARGKEGTGWSMAWKINFYARLHQGDEAYDLLRRLLKQVGTREENRAHGGTYSNLFCAHPPFQLDGNMGGAAGMAEMLIQSNEDMIRLLPAIPEKWSSGKVKGLKARGGFELAFEWSNGKIKKVNIKGAPGAQGVLDMGSEPVPFFIPASGLLVLKN